MLAEQRQDRQYSNVISTVTSNRSQIQTHVKKQVCFKSVQKMSNRISGR